MGSIHTVIVAVQAAEHEFELFLMGAQIPGKFLKVQLAILIGITHTYNLQKGREVRRVRQDVYALQLMASGVRPSVWAINDKTWSKNL